MLDDFVHYEATLNMRIESAMLLSTKHQKRFGEREAAVIPPIERKRSDSEQEQRWLAVFSLVDHPYGVSRADRILCIVS